MQYTKIPMSNVSTPGSWRPWALYTKSLSGFICLCLLLLIINVTVTLRCTAAGSCRIFGKSSDGKVPSQSAFVYHQLPTVLGVILGFIWIVPHHHILRLEPYFRMSDGKGEKAKNSLFLQYPYETSVLVPFKALLRGHYVVGLSSITLLLINFLIVPSLSRTFDMVVFTDSQLGTVKRASPNMNGHNVSADITFSAYNRAWRNGSLLPFMMDEYALLPLSTDGYSFALVEDWIAETTLYEAELQCVDAQPPVFGYVNNTLTVDITSIDGVNKVHICDAGARDRISQTSDCNDYTAFITPFTSMFWEIGNTANPPVSYMYGWASGPPSPPNITENSTFPKPTDITAIFCVPSYYTETVNATIKMPSGTVLGVARSGIRTKIPTLGGFDGILDANPEVSFAGELLIQGVPTIHEVPVRFGFQPETLASVETDLLERFGMSSRPIVSNNLGRTTKSNLFMTRTSTLSAFSLFERQNNTLEGLLDSRELQRMHERGLKMLFAFAAASMMGGKSDNMTLVDVERKVSTLRVTVNQAWALVVVLALCVVIVLTTLLTFFIKNRTLNLDSEPESMAASLKILSVSQELCDVMEEKEYCEPEKLCEQMNGETLILKLVMEGEGEGKHTVIKVEGVGAMAGAEATDVESSTGVGAGTSTVASTEGDAIKSEMRTDGVGGTGVGAKEEGDKELPKRKWEFGYLLRAVYIACFPIVTALLIFIIAFSKSKDGFPVPDGPTGIITKIVFGFIPTIVGSTFGSILISLGATYCMMRPYITLRARKARYSKSLATDYDSRPPQFRVIDPLQNNHYTLAALSISILLSQVFSITIGSLFTPPTIYSPRVDRHHIIYQNFSATRQEMYSELYKSLTTNYSSEWTTKDLYIDPPYEIAPNDEVTYDTVGFGMNVACNIVSRDRVAFPCSPQYSNTTDPACTNAQLRARGPRDNIMVIDNYCHPQKLSLLYWNGTCYDNILSGGDCTNRIFPVWVKNGKFDVTPPGPTDSYQFTALNCSVEDRVVSLRATVKDGQVLSTENLYSLDKGQIASHYATNMSTVAPLSISFINALQSSMKQDSVLMGNHQIARLNYLVATVNPSVVQEPRNETHIPDERFLADAFETVLQGLFVNLLQMSADRVFGAGVERAGDTKAYRVYVDTVNFAIAMAIMVFFCGVVAALCFGQGLHHVPHLPYSLAGAYLHLYRSDAIQDARDGTMSEGVYYLKKHPGGYHGVYKEEKVVEIPESMD